MLDPTDFVMQPEGEYVFIFSSIKTMGDKIQQRWPKCWMYYLAVRNPWGDSLTSTLNHFLIYVVCIILRSLWFWEDWMRDNVWEVLRTMSDTKEQQPCLVGCYYCYPNKDMGFREPRECLFASNFFTNSRKRRHTSESGGRKMYLYC